MVATSAVTGSTLRSSNRPNKPASAATSSAEPSRIGLANTSGSNSTDPTPATAAGSAGNLLAVEDLERDFAPVDVVLVESGGDNLTATFSPGLVDAQIFVLDVAGGGDVARKGGPGIARADLLVVNKIDLAPHLEVDADQMVADATAARQGAPVLALSRHKQDTVDQLCAWIRWMRHEHISGRHTPTDPGPMAPHFHARGKAKSLFHAHDASMAQHGVHSPRE